MVFLAFHERAVEGWCMFTFHCRFGGFKLHFSHAHTHRYTHADTHTHKDTKTRHKDTETQRHNDTTTQRHNDTTTQRHKDTKTHTHTRTNTSTHDWGIHFGFSQYRRVPKMGEGVSFAFDLIKQKQMIYFSPTADPINKSRDFLGSPVVPFLTLFWLGGFPY